jgi:(p)ppGpp synthase/HD superfamily hydrolase
MENEEQRLIIFKKMRLKYTPEASEVLNKLVDKALELASERQKGQLDDQGRPYFFCSYSSGP